VVIPLPPIESSAVWTATTGTLVATLCDAEDTWLVALNKTGLELIILKSIRHTVPTGYSINSTMAQIMHCLCFVVNECSNVSQAKMPRQEKLIVGMAVGINIRLEGGEDVGILGGGNCFEKHGRAIAGGEVACFLACRRKYSSWRRPNSKMLMS
jgi:hypothetical protein